MIRTVLVMICLLTVLMGPFVAIAAATKAKGYGNRESKSMCYFIGIACSNGPILPTAFSRMK